MTDAIPTTPSFDNGPPQPYQYGMHLVRCATLHPTGTCAEYDAWLDHQERIEQRPCHTISGGMCSTHHRHQSWCQKRQETATE